MERNAFGSTPKAREEIALIASIFIGTTEPIPHRDFFHARNLANFGFVGDGEWQRDGHLVASDETQCLTRRWLGQEQRVINRNQKAE